MHDVTGRRSRSGYDCDARRRPLLCRPLLLPVSTSLGETCVVRIHSARSIELDMRSDPTAAPRTGRYRRCIYPLPNEVNAPGIVHRERHPALPRKARRARAFANRGAWPDHCGLDTTRHRLCACPSTDLETARERDPSARGNASIPRTTLGAWRYPTRRVLTGDARTAATGGEPPGRPAAL